VQECAGGVAIVGKVHDKPGRAGAHESRDRAARAYESLAERDFPSRRAIEKIDRSVDAFPGLNLFRGPPQCFPTGGAARMRETHAQSGESATARLGTQLQADDNVFGPFREDSVN